MSEFEIKQRQNYKRNRKRWITVQTVALVLVVLIALASFLTYDRMDRTYYIEYYENGSADYLVKYVDNSFFDEEWIGSGQSYVASLIEEMSADFKYKLDMNASNVAFDYTWGITAQLIISDKHTGDHIYDPTDFIVPETTETVKGADGFTVGDKVIIDYNKYNSLARKFVDVYALKNATSMLVVKMNVSVVSTCDEFENNNSNNYSISLNIPLLEDNFSINSSSSAPNGEAKVLACKGAVNTQLFYYISIASALLAGILLLVLVVFIHASKNDDVNYTNKVRKLVRSYRSFIQEIDGEFDTEGYQIVVIKSFTELLGIRDTIQSPILMSENRDETMTQFLIPTNTKILYVFDIKVDNYDELYARIAADEAYEPIEVVMDSSEETAAEADVNIEADSEAEDAAEAEAEPEEEQETEEEDHTAEIEEAMAEPDVELSEIDFVDEIDEEFEETPEHHGLEVIGVVWPERAHKNKIYRYDPNGETLCDGDVVLVPTRDAAKGRDVIRKAAVAHGNHIIDPETYPHTLKKIICVVRHHEESETSEKE